MRKIVFIVLFLGIMNRIFTQNTDFLFMIEQAVKAPSGHNTQPWLFKTGETEIEIRPDFTKSLPVVDPDNRELFVSLGCAAENLCIAASHKGCYRGKWNYPHHPFQGRGGHSFSAVLSTVRQTNEQEYL